MDFHPTGDHLPNQLITDQFLLRPLRRSDVDLDYEAVMENPAMLRLSGGGVWPADDFTREANLADLIVHEQEHELGIAFTFTMVTPDQSRCLGCVYINPLALVHGLTTVAGEVPDKVGVRQAIVRYWVRHSLVANELDWRLVANLIEWFKSAWHFSSVYFRAHALDLRQKELMMRAGLPLAYTLEVPHRQGPFLAFGPA